MAIDDYDYEPYVSLCISEGCFMEFTIKKLESNNFSLTWIYKGTNLVVGSLGVKSITVVEGNHKWTFKTPYNIKGESGSYSF